MAQNWPIPLHLMRKIYRLYMFPFSGCFLLLIALLSVVPLAQSSASWDQMILAGGITINQDVPQFLDQAWATEIAYNDRHYKSDLHMTPESNPEIFVRGHAPNYFLYREYKLSGRTIVISTMFSVVTCDQSRFTGEYSYQFCQAKVTVSGGAPPKTSLVPRVCFYDVSEDPDYQQQNKPNGLFVQIDEKASIIHFMAWEKGRALPECAAQIHIP